MNHDQATDLEHDQGASPWRSIGSVAAIWAARIETERFDRDRLDEADYAPVAWAAE